MAASKERSSVVLLAVVVAAVAVAALQLEPAEALRGRSRVLWFPPSNRQRSGYPGFPRGRPSPPPSGRQSPPSVPAGRLTPPSPSTPPAPVGSPPCVGGGQQQAPLPGFPGMPGASSGSPPSSPTDCVTPLAGLMTCTSFLTGSEADTPTPQSECCGGLNMFLNSSAAADDRSLRCLCPVILGDVNRMLPKPIDPVRMMYLPIACGVVLPPQVLFICFTGQQTPPVVTRIPESWEKSSSSELSP